MKKAFLLILALLFPIIAYAAPPVNEYEDSGFLWHINQNNTLPQSYVPPALAEHKGYLLHQAVKDAFEAMLAEMEAQGLHELRIQSAYRSYSRQEVLFGDRVNSHMSNGLARAAAEAYASFYIAYPGASEHQAGLAVDVSVNGRLNRAFADTECYQWLYENCHKFGFIIRYQEFKTYLTGIAFEPWHLRYVGNPHASLMKEMNFCLEEYIQYLSESKRVVYWGDDGEYYVVYHYEELPQIMPRGIVDFSKDRHGDGAGYVITVKRENPELP